MRRRKSLKRKDAKKLLAKLSKIYKSVDAAKVESAEFETLKVYLFDDKIEFIENEKELYPALSASYLGQLPNVIVDMGAIPYVCNGADIMAPGIVELDDFPEGSLIVIRDVTHRKALAIGKAIRSSNSILDSKKGKVIENLHYVGDKLWSILS
jgi:PUA domain protein